jgi:hypothetical protein
MESNLIYRIRPSTLAHAYESKYKDKRATVTRRTTGYADTKAIIGRTPTTTTKYGRYQGNYKSKYYDPVARHERYMKERASLGIGQGGSGRGGGGGSGGGGGGGSGGSGGAGTSAAVANEIQKLREESSLQTEAQREAAKRKIEDLKAQLEDQVKKLRSEAETKIEGTKNTAEIRGITQNLKNEIKSLTGKTSDEIESVGNDLKSWISKEKDSLEARIASIYKSQGRDYKVTTQSDKANAAASRDREVSSRADSIYKKKT